ncbi:hypothetical protein DE146DRAFT_635111 [Phaeosphaeria sp. MPI-PUGE-AT-0046c]|nr:hypothetical protein DE146DRAFT_635111 [Phaeosphaeria sp. MPI-PUGE-AT-0046c]
MASGCTSKAQRASVAAREGGMVDIEVGEYDTNYQIHRALLLEHSEYFQKALNGPGKEAQKEGLDWENWRQSQDSNDAVRDVMIPLCGFAYRVLASGFRKAIEHAIIGLIVVEDLLVRYATFISAFTVLPSESPVLRLFVDSQCYRSKEEFDDNDIKEKDLRDQLPNKFLVRVMLRYSNMVKDRAFLELNVCDYHDHLSKEERQECKKVASVILDITLEWLWFGSSRKCKRTDDGPSL